MGADQSSMYPPDEQDVVVTNDRRCAWTHILYNIHSILAARRFQPPTLYTDLMDIITLEERLGGFSTSAYPNAPLCLTKVYRMHMETKQTGSNCLAYLLMYGLIMEKYMALPSGCICEKSCITAVASLLASDFNPEIGQSLLSNTR